MIVRLFYECKFIHILQEYYSNTSILHNNAMNLIEYKQLEIIVYQGETTGMCTS